MNLSDQSDHLEIIKEGVESWDSWREANPHVVPHLDGVNLVRAQLRGANLSHASLSRSDLRGANLREADLRGANLSYANLRGAYLREAILSGARLTGANLYGANLIGASCAEADFEGAMCWDTFFVAVDLSRAKSLAQCVHRGPSVVDKRTLSMSGSLPERFLRGCGFSSWEISLAQLYSTGLVDGEISEILRAAQAARLENGVQQSSVFISYSQMDMDFVDKIGARLYDEGVIFWRDVHDATAGPLEQIVKRAIELHPIVLLVLSTHSNQSDWVEFEAKQAREMEKRLNRHVLCPIALDDTWKRSAWSQVLRNQIEKYNILDFSSWRDAPTFEMQFAKLLTGIRRYYYSSN